MSEESTRDSEKRAPSVTRNETRRDSGFSVEASPFNPVKLELGYFILVGILLLLVSHRFADNISEQLLILFVYGLLAMLRLVYRVRQLLQQQHHNKE